MPNRHFAFKADQARERKIIMPEFSCQDLD